MSQAIYEDPEVKEMIAAREEGLTAVAFEMSLKGFDDERFQLWRVGRCETRDQGKVEAAGTS